MPIEALFCILLSFPFGVVKFYPLGFLFIYALSSFIVSFLVLTSLDVFKCFCIRVAWFYFDAYIFFMLYLYLMNIIVLFHALVYLGYTLVLSFVQYLYLMDITVLLISTLISFNG